MTTYTISSHTLDGSEVWGPYTAPDDSAWIKVKINSELVFSPPYQRMFQGPVHGLIERSLDGSTWGHYSWFRWHGDTFYLEGSGRDASGPAQFWVSIKEDGYQYRVTVTTSVSTEIFGEVEFDTVSARPTIDTGANNVGIVDYHLVRIQGSGGHGVSLMQEFASPDFDVRGDNAGIVVVSPEHLGLYVYPTGCDATTSQGDHKKVKWGLDGDDIPLTVRPGNECSISTPFYVKTGIPEQEYIHVDYWPDDPEGWLAGGTPPEEREITGCVIGTYAFLVVNNLRQDDPVYSTYSSGAINSDEWDTPYDGGTMEFQTNLSTLPGQLLISAGSYLYNPLDSVESPTIEHVSGATELFNLYKLWNASTEDPEPVVLGGGSDDWWQAASYKVADGDTNTLIGENLDVQPAWQEHAFYAAGAIALQETKYCHMVAVETPADPNDLPDADQVRAGTDGFDAAAVDSQSRGPDENGAVTFDPFTGADPNTDYTLCFVWEDEDEIVTYELTTLGAIYHVAVETPVDDLDLPNKEQIKAGTDGFDIAALDAQTKPAVSGTVAFDAFSGASPGTDYTLCFVYDNDDPVYYDLTTLAFNPFLARNCNVIIGVAA